MAENTNFRQELLKAINNNCPKTIQELLDSGIIQECQAIDGVYYISFGFHLKRQSFYNYKSDSYYFEFIHQEIKEEVIYVGGMAVDINGTILKGIIYPYYLNSPNSNSEEEKLMPYMYGTPQIINKRYNLNLNNFFAPGFCRVFNLITDSNIAWSEFILGIENYKNTHIPCDSKGKQIIYPSDDNDVPYFGNMIEGYKKLHNIKKYVGELITVENSVPISFIETYLKNKNLQSSIASKIYCTKEANKATIKGAEIQKKGLTSIALATLLAGKDARKGLSNVANALNKHPDVVYYK